MLARVRMTSVLNSHSRWMGIKVAICSMQSKFTCDLDHHVPIIGSGSCLFSFNFKQFKLVGALD